MFRPLLPKISWETPDIFSIDKLRFRNTANPNGAETTADEVVLMKSKPFIEKYIELLAPLSPKKFVEFGIFSGGSPLLHTLLFRPSLFVAIDVRGWLEGYETIIRRRKLNNIRTYYTTSQADPAKIPAIMEEHFASCDIDVVIDDASHQYELTRATFEMSFPYLREGGLYIIEDWDWSHYDANQTQSGWLFESRALSSLVTELIILKGSFPALISEVYIWGPIAAFRRGGGPMSPGHFRVADHLRLRGRPAPIY